MYQKIRGQSPVVLHGQAKKMTFLPIWTFFVAAVLRLAACDAKFSDAEETFLGQPDAQSARSHLRRITSRPHVAGTAGDRAMAGFVADRFRRAGIPDVSTFDLDALLNYPRAPGVVELLSSADPNKVVFRASLSEEILDFDGTSDTPWRNHTFHGYGASGDVTAPLVYANYGRPRDFDALEAGGVAVAGTIALVRYGRCFRGLKVRNARTAGAVGVLIYSDPQDDGYTLGPVYPGGPWRPASGVQRGSVQFNSRCAGDPMRADPRYAETVRGDLRRGRLHGSDPPDTEPPDLVRGCASAVAKYGRKESCRCGRRGLLRRLGH